MTSQYGFEALLAGKPVTCFGQPWYAGWGLTDDRHPQSALLSARRGSATLEELFAAAYQGWPKHVTGFPASKASKPYWEVTT
ncbi:hypothetical protein [Escherichia coli]|uniref:capsular polysaccharide export protein, LipB/KpsS family n=1 Tax=Escherichia coli TaxID=562 RepID=UPI0032D8C329